MSNPTTKKDLPIIRQTRFIVDKNRKYLFDVNHNITIYNLKRMIRVAANLNRGLRIFHEGVEYTDKDAYTLDELFPNKQLVEFTLQIEYAKIEELDDLITLKFKPFCKDHHGKYPYYYCYNCGKSICADCLREGKHKNHDVKEKYDYLQNSKNLVEGLFRDLKKMLDNTKGAPNDLIEGLKAKVQIQFFPKLIEIVKQIEQNMVNLILYFLDCDKNNFKTIQSNVVNLKDNCAEGLEKLKEDIEIEDIMIDENVFLTFDKKFKSINNEKEKIKHDLEAYQTFSDNLKTIQTIIEKTYKEIYDFLIKYLEITKFTEIHTKISQNKISQISKEEVLNHILGDVERKNKPKFIEFLKNIRKLDQPSAKKTEEDVEMKDVSKKSTAKKQNVETAKKEKSKDGKIVDTYLDKDVQNTTHHDAKYSAGAPGNEMELRSGTVKNVPKTDKELLEDSYDEDVPGPIFRRVYSIVPGTKKVFFYNAHKKTNKDKDVDFPNLLGVKNFNNDCAWVNYNNKLYVLGGKDEKGKLSRLFLEYDGIKNSFKRLPDSKFAHLNHTLYAFNNVIYSIGGKDTDCEKYEFSSNSWTSLPKMNFTQNNPVICIQKDFIYSFFGNDEKGKRIDQIQKLNLTANKAKWTPVNYDKGGCNLKIFGCAVLRMEENKIYFFGGKTEHGVSKGAIEFDFVKEKASKTECLLGQNAYFKDTVLLKISDDVYGNYSIDKNFPLITVTLNK